MFTRTEVLMGSPDQVRLEDPLAYLPCSNILECRKGEIIYDRNRVASSLYLVIDGKVKINRIAPNGSVVVVDIYRPDEFFGEDSFLQNCPCGEQAQALETTKLMAWAAQEVEELISRQPRLAIALIQVFVQRSQGLRSRIEFLATDNIGKRVARALLHFANELGQLEPDGSVHMIPLTHELLAQYVGTSREVVTMHMNRFRREGYLRYSRKTIIVYVEALQEWLRREPGLDGRVARLS